MTTVHYNRQGEFVEWIQEVKNIHDSFDEDALKEDDVVPDITDECGRATQFLVEIGLNALAQGGKDGDDDIMSILTGKQKATVKKRLDTLRPKSKAHHPDVRDIFFEPNAPDAADCYHDGQALTSPSKPLMSPPGHSTSHPTGHSTGHRTNNTVKSSNNTVLRPPPESPRHSRRSEGLHHSITDSLVNCGIEMASPNPNQIQSPITGKDLHTPSVHGRVSPSSPGYAADSPFEHDDGCGVTRINDLGKKDYKMLSVLANIELESVFDDHKISYIRHKSKRKSKDHGVYGVSLQTLSDRDRKKTQDRSAPLFLQQLIEHLEKHGLSEEGILRVPGAMARMKELRQDIDSKWPRGKFSFENMTPHDTAGLLKQFLRDLPDSLLTLEKMDAFLKVLDVADEEKRLNLLKLIVITLPEVNRDTLQLLLSFLCKVIDQPENRMMLASVAMIIAPNLFVVRSGSTHGHAKPGDIEAELQMAERTSKVVTMLIEHEKELWTVPSFLLVQIREKNKKNETKKTRISLPVLNRKDRSDVYRITQIGDRNSASEITVSLEDSGEISLPINDTTTSNDVISQVLTTRSPKPNKKAMKSIVNVKSEHNDTVTSKRHDNSLSPHSTDGMFLYEIGGNIGERRLDGEAKMKSIVEVNPSAKFVVRKS